MLEKTTVLYIEDDVGSQRLVQRVLENNNFQVFVAGEGMAGINIARRQPPNLVLMDINLPGLNGREITTRLRSLPDFDKIPIIALTANSSPGHRERALAAGCDGFLTKPINVGTFSQEVSSFLRGQRERLDNEERLTHLQAHAQELVTRLEDKILELEEANRRLREVDRLKSDFMALVSHELRTPLTLLEGYTHLLDERTGSNLKTQAELQPLVDGLKTGVKRIGDVIGEVINVSRITSGTLQLSMGPVRLTDLLDKVHEAFAPVAQQRRLDLHFLNYEGLPIIEGDGKQLFVALKHVVGNAIKYTPDGGAITVRSRLVGDAIDVEVKDSGIGVPIAEQRRIFEHFFVLESIDNHSSSKSAFQGGGLGLGLAITKGIVEAHQGRVWLESAGRDEQELPGSIFHVLLPLRQAKEKLPTRKLR